MVQAMLTRNKGGSVVCSRMKSRCEQAARRRCQQQSGYSWGVRAQMLKYIGLSSHRLARALSFVIYPRLSFMSHIRIHSYKIAISLKMPGWLDAKIDQHISSSLPQSLTNKASVLAREYRSKSSGPIRSAWAVRTACAWRKADIAPSERCPAKEGRARF